MKKGTFVLTCLLLIVPCQGRTITVDDDGPADFNNIQAAVDDANGGDTIIVADGIYTGPGNRDIAFLGKAITVRSGNGFENCIIDVNASDTDYHRGFYFQNNEEANSVIEGFTIKNAKVGGVFYPDIIGGGILCVGASPTITKCYLTLNQAGEGGGIFLRDSSANITYCLITENYAGKGGGIAVYSPYIPVIKECQISYNTAGDIGGGLYTRENSGIDVHQCIFVNNEAVGAGGGIHSLGSSVSKYIVNCEFIANQANSGAGIALYGFGLDAWIINCVFLENQASHYGAGINISNCGYLVPNIMNCTFSNNVAGVSAGAVSGCGDSRTNPKISNSIVWANEPNSDAGIAAIWDGAKGGFPAITADLSILQRAWQTQNYLRITNCIVADPCFADPCNGDFHLKSQAGRWDTNSQTWVQDSVTSVAIDAGNPMDPVGLEPFPNGGIINMGAYGGTAEASKSFFGGTPCQTIVAGDINGDCIVDFKDFGLMAFHWLDDNN
jgi:hypothetical protein